MSHTDMGITGATTGSFILFENGVGRNRLVLRLPDLNLLFYILRDFRRTIGGNIADLGRVGKSGNALRLP
jgi:hypothetical protein